MTTQNEEIAKRFTQFAELFVSKKQEGLAEKFGMSQASISRLRSGKQPITIDVLAVLINSYHLNFDWLLTGEGNMKTIPSPKKRDTITDISAMKADVEMILKQLRLLQNTFTYTTNKLNDRAARQDERVEDMERVLREVRDYQRN